MVFQSYALLPHINVFDNVAYGLKLRKFPKDVIREKDLNILKAGVIEGRKVYVNTIKYVKMIGSINFGYVFSLILASLFFNFNPMGAMMILIFSFLASMAR